VSLYDVCHAAGGMTKHAFEIDPKRLLFILSRYKFVARMLEGKDTCLEVGCADGYGSRIVRQHVKDLYAIDIDAESISEAKRNQSVRWPITFSHCDFMSVRTWVSDSVFALDVIEHIEAYRAYDFLARMSDAAPVAIIGTPSLESQPYASELSKIGHINCYTAARLRKECSDHWRQVFIFSMNDEVVHTGFHPMAHYLFAVCVR